MNRIGTWYHVAMEHLSFSDRGQWTLTKSSPASAYVHNFADYRDNATGELPKDYGKKGGLHGAKGSNMPPRQMSDDRMKTKTPTPKISAFNSRNPSLEDDSVSDKIDRI